MGASCSSCFYTAEAEELEALTTVGSEGASASRSLDLRILAMMRSRILGMMRDLRGPAPVQPAQDLEVQWGNGNRLLGQFSDAVAQEIEGSKPHWSEVNRRDVEPQSAEEKRLNRENREVLVQLRAEHPDLFGRDLEEFVLGPMIAEGGQAQIYKVRGRSDLVMKVFKRGTPLRALRGLCPLPVLDYAVRQCIWNAGMLKDGRFAFLMHRFWGDLRKLIDQAMREKNANGIQGPPFPYRWVNGRNLHPTHFMFEVAVEMRDLHEKGVSHRDLKASNILFESFNDWGGFFNPRWFNIKWTIIADFECSIGVLGTGFWRAPEILEALGNASTISNEQWKKADVYSYGMTCFEIVTGQIPFEGELEHTKAHRQLVIDGKRPQLPSDLDDAMKNLITKCWAQNPNSRPTFSQIVDTVETILKTQCEFRLFDIGDELPSQYRLATVQETDEYPIALSKAMPRLSIANLANGSIARDAFTSKTRLEKQSDARYKLARKHY